MQAPKFNLEEFIAGRNALTGNGKVAQFIVAVTEPGAAYPIIVRVGDEVRRYNKSGEYWHSLNEDLVHMEPKRIAYRVEIDIDDRGLPYIKDAVQTVYDPYISNTLRTVHINSFE